MSDDTLGLSICRNVCRRADSGGKPGAENGARPDVCQLRAKWSIGWMGTSESARGMLSCKWRRELFFPLFGEEWCSVFVIGSVDDDWDD